ncbi:hypothetical protein [Promicromonospora sp. NFX87]|uniref:hypothetical protein n=1 Tax=Promicromonospora sp. NFX87 TaxID=3402691 RepID=UPI003AFB1699
MTWLTDEQAIALWADAATMDPDVLALLLNSAYTDCVEFLPALPEGEDYADKSTPNRMLAQAYQAKSRYNALLGGSEGGGTAELSLTIFPLDWQVKQLLRPKKGRPGF